MNIELKKDQNGITNLFVTQCTTNSCEISLRWVILCALVTSLSRCSSHQQRTQGSWEDQEERGKCEDISPNDVDRSGRRGWRENRVTEYCNFGEARACYPDERGTSKGRLWRVLSRGAGVTASNFEWLLSPRDSPRQPRAPEDRGWPQLPIPALTHRLSRHKVEQHGRSSRGKVYVNNTDHFIACMLII